MGLLVVSALVSRLVIKNQTKSTMWIRKIAFIEILIIALLFLLWVIVVTYYIGSGRILEGWEF